MRKLLTIWLTCFALLLTACTKTAAIDYSKYDLNNIDSIPKATKTFQKEFNKKRGTKEAEEGYSKFLEFYYRAVETQSRLKMESGVPFEYKASEDSFQKQAQQYSKEYIDKGMIVHFDEGEFFIVPSNQYLYNKFSSYLPEDKKELMKFETLFDKRMISDARYVIPKSEIKDIIKFYENFLKKYPNFTYRNEIMNTIKRYKEDLKHYPNIVY